MPSYLTAIPDPESGWSVYSGNRRVAEGSDLGEAVGNRANVIVGVPVNRAPTFLVTLPATSLDLVRPMVFAQIEKRGLAAGSMGETVFDFDLIEEDAGQAKIAVHLIDSPLSDEMILPGAAGYAPSALVRQRIDDGAVLWVEHRHLSLAIFHRGKLLHSQVLAVRPELNAAAALEINLLLLSLEGDPAFEECLPTRLAVLVDDVSAEEEKSFSAAVRLETAFSELRGADRKAKPRPALTPLPVLAVRRRRKIAIWASAVAVLLLAAYFTAGVFIWQRAESNRGQITALRQQIALLEPDVEEIQRVESRWRELEPAFELKWFPIVQLSRITEALPGSGVVIREYRTRGRNIYIRGQARDVQLAFRLQEDLSSIAEFDHYDWTMPKPDMENDNTATFQIEGKPKES